MSFVNPEYMFLSEFGISVVNPGYYVNGAWKGRNNSVINSLNPITNEIIASVRGGSMEDYEEGMQACSNAAKLWMEIPATNRCEIVRQIGDALKAKYQLLSQLVSLEVGKRLGTGRLEVEEAIDMCYYAAGLSEKLNQDQAVLIRQCGNQETLQVWNPLGVVGVITPFNFPCAVLGRNACMALVTGNCVVWKGSTKTPLVTIAMTKLVAEVLKNNNLPSAIFTSFCGGFQIGQAIAEDKRIPLVSFTGTSKVGLMVQQRVNDRFGKCLLALSRSSVITVMGDANIELAIATVVLDAAGVGGQCRITCHRLLLQEGIYEMVLDQLLLEYTAVINGIGDPLKEETRIGPLHTVGLKRNFKRVMRKIRSQGGKILIGGSVIVSKGNFVQPTIVEISPNADVVKEESFVPVLYVFKFQTFEESIEINNSISPGSTNSIFTRNPKAILPWIRYLESEYVKVNPPIGANRSFESEYVNVNPPTMPGAESDSWEQYKRQRTICTINY